MYCDEFLIICCWKSVANTGLLQVETQCCHMRGFSFSIDFALVFVFEDFLEMRAKPRQMGVDQF